MSLQSTALLSAMPSVILVIWLLLEFLARNG